MTSHLAIYAIEKRKSVGAAARAAAIILLTGLALAVSVLAGYYLEWWWAVALVATLTGVLVAGAIVIALLLQAGLHGAEALLLKQSGEDERAALEARRADLRASPQMVSVARQPTAKGRYLVLREGEDVHSTETWSGKCWGYSWSPVKNIEAWFPHRLEDLRDAWVLGGAES